MAEMQIDMQTTRVRVLAKQLPAARPQVLSRRCSLSLPVATVPRSAAEPSRAVLMPVGRSAGAGQRCAAQQTMVASTEQMPDFRVVIAGAGISGLTLALGLLKSGVRVQVLERDLTAIRGEGKIRGPIQVGHVLGPAS